MEAYNDYDHPLPDSKVITMQVITMYWHGSINCRWSFGMEKIWFWLQSTHRRSKATFQKSSKDKNLFKKNCFMWKINFYGTSHFVFLSIMLTSILLMPSGFRGSRAHAYGMCTDCWGTAIYLYILIYISHRVCEISHGLWHGEFRCVDCSFYVVLTMKLCALIRLHIFIIK